MSYAQAKVYHLFLKQSLFHSLNFLDCVYAFHLYLKNCLSLTCFTSAQIAPILKVIYQLEYTAGRFLWFLNLT